MKTAPADCVAMFRAYRDGDLPCPCESYTNAALVEPDLSFKLEPTWPDSIPDRPPKNYTRIAYPRLPA